MLLLALVVAEPRFVRPVQEVRVVATPGGFVPKEVRVRAGIPTRLVVTSVDLDHSLLVLPYPANQEGLRQGRTTTLEFTPQTPGRYPFHCTVYGGSDPSEIVGLLLVE